MKKGFERREDLLASFDVFVDGVMLRENSNTVPTIAKILDFFISFFTVLVDTTILVIMSVTGNTIL